MKKIKKIDLYNVDPLKKPEMRKYQGGGYLYCHAYWNGGSIISGYCGTASTEEQCCKDIISLHNADGCWCNGN